ncbi:MAG: PspC domain-containing protein [Bacteroidota bacterium]
MESTKRLYRSVENRYIGGVCSGLAKYFNVDVVIIRLLFFLALIIGGGGFLAYIILWIVVPEEPVDNYYVKDEFGQENYSVNNNTEAAKEPKEQGNPKKHPGHSQRGNLIGGLILLTIGLMFLIDNFIPRIYFSDLWPFILIIAGVAVLVNSNKKSYDEKDPEFRDKHKQEE